MCTITLKNIPKALHSKLFRRAAANKRSLNQETIACLEESLQTTKCLPAHLLENRFQNIRQTIQTLPLTDDFLKWAVNHGRE